MNRSKIIASMAWKLLERVGTQGIQLVVQIILARILLPSMYGTVALVMVFVNMAQIFLQSGLSTALIQKKDIDDIDFASVFVINTCLAVALYIIIFFAAPHIASFYGNSELAKMLRVLGITILIGAISSVQTAYITRNMQFKLLFKSTLATVIISGGVGIFAAYSGAGAWSLLLQQLVNQGVITVILLKKLPWRPRFRFSLTKAGILWSFGYKLLISSIIETVYQNLRTLIVGRRYDSSVLGLFSKGEQIPRIIVQNINGAMQTVMLPVLSKSQETPDRIKSMVSRAIRTSSYMIFPLMIGIAAVAEPMIKVILTEKWLDAVPFIRIFCIYYSLYPIHTANLQAINALGRSDIFLKLEIIKKFIGVVILLITVRMGVYAMALGGLIGGIAAIFVNAYPNKKLLNYNYLEQVKDFAPSLVLSILMGIAVYFLSYLNLAPILLLIMQILLGLFVYISMSSLFKVESFRYLLGLLMDWRTHLREK